MRCARSARARARERGWERGPTPARLGARSHSGGRTSSRLRGIGLVEQGSSVAGDGVFTMEKPDAELLAAGKAALKEAVKEYRRLEEAARLLPRRRLNG